MNNCAGVSRDIILSKEAFEVLVRASLRQLHNPCQQCLSMVTRELLSLAEESEPVEVLRCGSPLAHMVGVFFVVLAGPANNCVFQT
jgi:hypothetical protein